MLSTAVGPAVGSQPQKGPVDRKREAQGKREDSGVITKSEDGGGEQGPH